MPNDPGAILDFWFGRKGDKGYGEFRDEWFQQDTEFDERIRDLFLEDYERAVRGEYDDWQEKPQSCLALVILLDQFPRNLFRGDRQTYATDNAALEVSREAVQKGIDQKLPPFQRHLLYMPFMHSEDAGDQRRSIELFRKLAAADAGPDIMEFAEGHQDTVERFGRFPHRNVLLGRSSTPGEVEFLGRSGS